MGPGDLEQVETIRMDLADLARPGVFDEVLRQARGDLAGIGPLFPPMII
jgi:hypothetical protein